MSNAELPEPCPWCNRTAIMTDLAPSQRYRLIHAPTCFLINRMVGMRAHGTTVFIGLHEVAQWNTRADLVSSAAAPSTSSEAWREWFTRIGERATVDVVNATATLVIAERELVAAPAPSEDGPTCLMADCAEQQAHFCIAHVLDAHARPPVSEDGARDERRAISKAVEHWDGLLKDSDRRLQEAHARIAELERRLRIPFGKFPCAQCGGPHNFDTSVPSVVWNSVIRANELPDYLCTACIVREFVRSRQGFTATLWNEEFNGVPIEVIVNGQNAKDAALIQEENNALRNRIADLEASAGSEDGAVAAAREQGLNLFRQLVGGKNALRQLNVFWCNDAEHDADCKCFWEQCEAWAKIDAATPAAPCRRAFGRKRRTRG